MRVCDECKGGLTSTARSSPPCSLVRVDRGPRPPELDEPLTYLELLFLSLARPSKKMVTCKAENSPRAPSQCFLGIPAP